MPLFSPFPLKGMIQFYLSPKDDLMGLNFDDQTNQAIFRVLYHPEVIEIDNQRVTDLICLQMSDVTPDTSTTMLAFVACSCFTLYIAPCPTGKGWDILRISH
ncbi:DUF1963 domain-containing protein [Fictibacillus solisalsi]|uniref:DUF1963 domain-containing protein n=1 Tax=Fictibacillus solisalsi TaxID=459525 RepID=UPI003CC7A7AC